MPYKRDRNVPLSILRNILLESIWYKIEITNVMKRAEEGVVARLRVDGAGWRSGEVIAEGYGENIREAIEALEKDWEQNADEAPADERVRE